MLNSFIIKLSGAILLLLSGVICGLYYADRLRRRRDFLRSFIGLLSNLKTSVRYTSFEIIPLIKQSAPNNIAEYFYTDKLPFAEYWSISLMKIPKSCGLKKDDYNLLSNFGALLGSTDVQGQLNHISLYEELFQKALDNSSEEYKTKGKLYRLLGFFCGAALALLLI